MISPQKKQGPEKLNKQTAVPRSTHSAINNEPHYADRTKPITVTNADASLLLIDSDRSGDRSDAMMRFHSSHPFQSALLYSGRAMPSLPPSPLFQRSLSSGGSFQRDRESIRRAKSLLCRYPGINYQPISSSPSSSSCQAKGLVPRSLCSRGIFIPYKHYPNP